jgi:hypothetical protein
LTELQPRDISCESTQTSSAFSSAEAALAESVKMDLQTCRALPPLKILLCSPRGFCAGVVRAIDAVERALAKYGPPVYVRHEIVHNRYVVESLKCKGAIFVE